MGWTGSRRPRPARGAVLGGSPATNDEHGRFHRRRRHRRYWRPFPEDDAGGVASPHMARPHSAPAYLDHRPDHRPEDRWARLRHPRAE
ncbi:hypothetical protein ACFQYP_53770 [Nonomuraea antimicrobica]